MQCRICLEESDPDQMISPCRCRGSVAYIHRGCLQQYIQYYPDGICRVCRTPFLRPFSIGETMFVCLTASVFASLVFYSHIPGVARVALFCVAVGALVLQYIRNLYTRLYFIQFLALVAIPLLIGNTPALLEYFQFLATAGTLYAIFAYIPFEYICMIVLILLAAAYVILFLLALLMLDFYAFVIVLSAFGILIHSWMRSHPPLWLRAE